MLETAKKQDFSSRNTEDIYKEFTSAKVHELNKDIEDEHVQAVISAVRNVTWFPVEFDDIKS